jgi:hypothetical protein
MYDIFLSYSGQDREWVRKLADQIAEHKLHGRNLRVWFDERDMGPGEFIVSRLELALQESNYIGIVLTPEALKSDWVQFERNIFQSQDPMGARKKILPILLKDCKLPPSLAAISYIDFRNPSDFDDSLSRLVQAICRGEASERVSQDTFLDLLRQALEDRSIRPTPAKDALFDYISQRPIRNLFFEGHIYWAFNTMLEIEDHDATLIAAECAAVLMARSVRYNRIPQLWIANGGKEQKIAAMRAYSKLAEIDPEAVDTSGLLDCAISLEEDGLPSASEDSAFIHLVRALGKIKSTSTGQDLIEALSFRGPVQKAIAAAAIGISFADGILIYHLSEMQKVARNVADQPPSPRLCSILARLSTDRDSAVRVEAGKWIKYLQSQWIGISFQSESASLPVSSESTLVKPTHPMEGSAPFAGRILKVSETDIRAASKRLRSGDIVCLNTRGADDTLFCGASAFFIPEQHSFTHQCDRLRASGVPFAILSQTEMEELPEGAYAVVDKDGIHITTMGDIDGTIGHAGC